MKSSGNKQQNKNLKNAEKNNQRKPIYKSYKTRQIKLQL